jgi:hypothetical protein
MGKGMSGAVPVQDDLLAIGEERLRLPSAGRAGDQPLQREPSCHFEPHALPQLDFNKLVTRP